MQQVCPEDGSEYLGSGREQPAEAIESSAFRQPITAQLGPAGAMTAIDVDNGGGSPIHHLHSRAKAMRLPSGSRTVKVRAPQGSRRNR